MPGLPPDIRVSDDPARPVAELLADQAARGGSIVLTGGSTPARAYHLAASLQPDWGRTSVWWGDERCVPPDDDRSNFKLAAQSLLDRLETPPDEVHRIRGELPPARAADELEEELDGVALDLMLLGLGPDGHLASLFPGTPQLAVEDRRVTWGRAGLEPFVDRVTMTLPTIRSAARIVFLVTGPEKAEAVAAAFGGDISDSVPASLARLAPVPIEVFLDAAAKSKLDNT